MGKLLEITFLEKMADLANCPIFEISSEAFQAFHMLFTLKKEKDRKVVAEFIIKNYDKFFKMLNSMIQTQNYLSIRDSLRNLYYIFEDPINEIITIKFISNKVTFLIYSEIDR